MNNEVDWVFEDADPDDLITTAVITAGVAIIANAPKIYRFGKMAWNLYQADKKAKEAKA